jgi:Holliday junction resolvase RusA-like endonuclease
MSMRVELPLPDSDNGLYWNNPHGGRTLTTKAKAYKRGVKDKVSRLIASTMSAEDFVPNVPYTVIITIYFDQLEWKTFGATGGAKTRYKKCDAGNRQKLVIDAVMDAIGIDDKHIFREVIRKREDETRPRVVVVVREQEARYGRR